MQDNRSGDQVFKPLDTRHGRVQASRPMDHRHPPSRTPDRQVVEGNSLPFQLPAITPTAPEHQDTQSWDQTSKPPVVRPGPVLDDPRNFDQPTLWNHSQTARDNILPSLLPTAPPLIVYEQPDMPPLGKSGFCRPFDVNLSPIAS